MGLRISDDMTNDEARLVERKLIEFADEFTQPRNQREIRVALRDEDGNVLGGITANMVWDWLQIGVLWVSESVRGQGFGHRLLERVEELAREDGCRHARLNTFEFEARGFYETHGYVVHSVTRDFPSGHTQYHLTKQL